MKLQMNSWPAVCLTCFALACVTVLAVYGKLPVESVITFAMGAILPAPANMSPKTDDTSK